jgi:hypothetical protein
MPETGPIADLNAGLARWIHPAVLLVATDLNDLDLILFT